MPWSPTIRAALLAGTPWPDGAPARRSICGPSIVTRWLLSAPWCSACGAPASAPMSKHRLGRDGTGSADRMKKKAPASKLGLGRRGLGGEGDAPPSDVKQPNARSVPGHSFSPEVLEPVRRRRLFQPGTLLTGSGRDRHSWFRGALK
jgi:hypothetical protein